TAEGGRERGEDEDARGRRHAKAKSRASGRRVAHQYFVAKPDQLLVTRPDAFLYQLWQAPAQTDSLSSLCSRVLKRDMASGRTSIVRAPRRRISARHSST